MNRAKLFLSLLALAVPLTAADRVAKNIIVFLGDAGGLPTLNAASIYGYNEPRRLFIHSMPHIALSETSSSSRWVTDSAAGMTAIMTGQKTKNGVIAQSPDVIRGKKDGAPLKTVLEYAEEQGLATGVVSNSNMLSATPAACYAHVNDRKDLPGVFKHLVSPRFGDGVDAVIGHGRKVVLEAAKAAGMDGRTALKKAGLEWYESLDAVPATAKRVTVLFDDEFDINAAAQKAIDVLSRNPKGFFLMVESDLHTEKIVQGLERAVAFDKMIRAVAGRMDDDTLILVTADHSYDFRVSGGDRDAPLLTGEEQGTSTDDLDTITWKNVRRQDDHTGEDVIVAARGPGAEKVRGFLSNTDLFHIMMSAYGWKAGGQ